MNRLRPRRALVYVASVLLVVFVSSCDIDGQGPGHRSQSLAMSPSEEVEVGRAAAGQLLSKAPVVDSGPEAKIVTKVGRRISQVIQNDALMREINLHVSNRLRQLQAWIPQVEAAKRAEDEGRIAPAGR